MTLRPIARLVAAAAVVLLGAVAAARLPLGFAPARALPGLTVVLSLPDSPGPEEVARAWALPVESGIRALGGVREIAGEVSGDGLYLEARLTPGSDPDRKAARLLSELSDVSRRLPPGGTLQVHPDSTSGAAEAVLGLSGEDAATRSDEIADELRALPGVRSVAGWGGTPRETRIRLRAGTDARAVRAVVSASLAPRLLGELRSRERLVPVLSRAPELSRLSVAGVPLGSLASIERGVAPAESAARISGKSGVAFVVTGERALSPIALERSLRSYARALRTRTHGTLVLDVLSSPADPLRLLSARLLTGAALALAALSLLGFAVARLRGALLMAASLPLSFAAAMNSFFLCGIPLDSVTLPAVALALAAAAPVAASRVLSRGAAGSVLAAQVAAAAFLPWLAAALAGGELLSVLSPAARAFAIASFAASFAMLLLPRAPRASRPSGLRFAADAARRLLREPASVLLACAALAAALLELFGPSLALREKPRPVADQLRVRVELPEGSSLAEAESAASTVEKAAEGLPGIARTWGFVRPGAAWLRLDVREKDRRGDRLLELKTDLGYRLAGTTARLEDVSEGASLMNELETRPETDEESRGYRFVVRATSVESLRTAIDRVRARLSSVKIAQANVSVAWGAPGRRVLLSPRREVSPEAAAELASALDGATEPPRAIPGARRVSVLPAGAEGRGTWDAPQRAALFARPLALSSGTAMPAALVSAREELVPASCARQAGRFVVPVSVRFPAVSEGKRRDERTAAHRGLGLLELPTGCDILRPTSLTRFSLPPRKLRLAMLAIALPALLLAFHAFLLDSVLLGSAALLSAVPGIACAAPAVSGAGGADPLALLAIACGLAGAAALAIAPCANGRRVDRLYRTLRERLPVSLTAAAAWLLLPGAAAVGADPARAPWGAPLLAASLAGFGAALATSVPLGALLLASRALRGRDLRAARRERRPRAWTAPEGPPLLAARSLTKIYPGGVRALADVSFELRPGVTGVLGPNGAGKTTLLRLLTGLLAPTRGQVLFRGVAIGPRNLASYRRHIGVLPQEFQAYEGLTAEEFLDVWALEKGIASRAERSREIGRLLESVDLAADARRKVRDFSGGMRQRIGIAQALLGSPPVLVVDEPTTGLDVEARAKLRDLLAALGRERIVLLSTHLAGDLDVASSLLLVHRGRLVWDGPAEGLLARAEGKVFEALVADRDLRAFGARHRVTARVRTREGVRVRAVVGAGVAPEGTLVPPALEEAYLSAIGENRDPAAAPSALEFLFREAS